MNNRIDAIYARQSVDKKDSISIESQIEFCKYELKGGNCKEYTDKGYSGKNTDRPKFQELVRDIKRGLIAKVIVYKLDRISRSILDFANMMELFQQYDVEFVSSTEKFDTSTPMGRAMLNICIVFAQLERETIQKRVTDAYYSRSQRGFKMGGKAPYGFHTEPIKMDGINTKKLVVNPDEAANIRLIFEMYAQPTTSYGDITRYFAEQGILFYGKELIRPTLAQMLRNPVYVQADLDVYEFFKSQGTVIVNDAADFTGTNGCYLYQGRDVKPSKKNDLKDQMLVLAPHEGIVPADIWLACRKKLMNNMKIQSARKATHTWLAGKIKCGNCGYALMSIFNPSGRQYLRCTKRLDNKSCPGCGKIITSELEAVVYQQMVKKLEKHKTLTGRKKAAKGITARNQLIEMATASLSDLMKEHPEHRAEAKQDLQLLNAQKMGEHEAEIEKIKNVFLAILRDIKKDIDNGEQPGEAVTAAMFQAMRDALAEQKQNPLSIDDVAAMVAGQIGQLTPMDEETADLFKQLAKKMMKGIE